MFQQDLQIPYPNVGQEVKKKKNLNKEQNTQK